jgi:D-hexose-6-phosphate mutarotase
MSTPNLSSHVEFVTGNGGFPKLILHSAWSSAEIYLHGAQVTHFQKHGEAPLLFLSGSSRFQKDAPIRGGVPLCFPWFGPRGGIDGQPMHGFARIRDWALNEVRHQSSGELSATFGWSDQFEGASFAVKFRVTVGLTLQMDFTVQNTSKKEFAFEECLHTYFHVGDISRVSIRGLNGAQYLDKTDAYKPKPETASQITIDREVDRTYVNTDSTVEILDQSLNRKITVKKTHSKTTVVWNPWIERAKQMADLGDTEYLQMVCVESGNAGENKIVLPPNESSTLSVILSSERL